MRSQGLFESCLRAYCFSVAVRTWAQTYRRRVVLVRLLFNDEGAPVWEWSCATQVYINGLPSVNT